MGLMDKVKSQATQLAEKAQQAGQAGQAKLAEIQAKKKADAMLLELGGIAYQEKTGRADSSSGARAGELTELLKKHEAEHGPVTVTSANAAIAEAAGVVDPTATPPAPSSTPPTSSGGPIPQAQYGSEQD
jgi:predicted PilT family ATPase